MAIGTTAAVLGAAAIGGGASLASGAMQASAANRAAGAQENAAREANALQREMFETNRQDMMPWLEAGRSALTNYMGEMGLGDAGFQSQFQATPGYDFLVKEGEKGVMNNLSALGMRDSGAALKSLTQFRTGLASQEYGNYMNRLGALSGVGQTQANTLGQMGQNVATNMGNNIQNAGTARASGYMGAANAWSNALGGVGNNVSGALGMLNYNANRFPSAGGLY